MLLITLQLLCTPRHIYITPRSAPYFVCIKPCVDYYIADNSTPNPLYTILSLNFFNKTHLHSGFNYSTPDLPYMPLFLRVFDGYDEEKAEEYRKTKEAVGGPPIAGAYIAAIVTCCVIVVLCDLDTYKRHRRMFQRNIRESYCRKQ